MTITAAGLAVIGLTSGGAEDSERASLAALIAIEGANPCGRGRAHEDLDSPPPPAAQRGAAPPAASRSATASRSNLAPILGGILIFYDPIGSGALEFTARFLAFCLVIAGAALMPPRYAPRRTAAG